MTPLWPLSSYSESTHTHAHTLRLYLSSHSRIRSAVVSHQTDRVVGWITACGQACHKEHCQQWYFLGHLHAHRLCTHNRLYLFLNLINTMLLSQASMVWPNMPTIYQLNALELQVTKVKHYKTFLTRWFYFKIKDHLIDVVILPICFAFLFVWEMIHSNKLLHIKNLVYNSSCNEW